MYFVYILSNWNHRVIYTGVTNDLQRRLYEHRNGTTGGFTKQYQVHTLVFFEETSDIRAAIAREKQIKGWKRQRKNLLIESKNPHWEDLSRHWEADAPTPNVVSKGRQLHEQKTTV